MTHMWRIFLFIKESFVMVVDSPSVEHVSSVPTVTTTTYVHNANLHLLQKGITYMQRIRSYDCSVHDPHHVFLAVHFPLPSREQRPPTKLPYVYENWVWLFLVFLINVSLYKQFAAVRLQSQKKRNLAASCPAAVWCCQSDSLVTDITAALKDDVPMIYQIDCNCFESPYSQDYFYGVFKNKQAWILVARASLESATNNNATDLAGYILYNPVSRNEIRISSVAVLKQYQGFGIGRKLMEAALNAIQKMSSVETVSLRMIFLIELTVDRCKCKQLSRPETVSDSWI